VAQPSTRPSSAAPISVAVINQFPQQLIDDLRSIPGVRVSFDPALFAPQRFRSDPRGEEGFRRTDVQQAQLAAQLADAEVIIGLPDGGVGGLADLLRLAPKARWVQGMPAGTGETVARAGLTPEQLERVQFTTGAGVYSDALAEWAMFGVLAFVKELPYLLANRDRREWGHRPARELTGATMVVVGLGDIGRRTAALAAAFGMRVIGVRRTAADESALPDGVDRVIGPDRLGEVLPDADAVVLALPGTRQTDGMFSAELIAALPQRAVVVNVGRGTTVDEPALIEALRAGRIAGAALDVTAVEPLPADSPLWSMPNVLLSTHTAAASENQDNRRIALAAENLRRYVAGQPLRNVVDTTHFY
jgi:phosphoglycerate dehydrogenase-like enzyme